MSFGQSSDVVRRTQNVNTTATGINQYLASSNPAVAFNPFGVGANNATTIAAVRNGQFQIHGDTKLTTASLQADGSAFQLPGGAVRVALGAEYRREALGGLLESGSTAAPVVVPSSISRHMYAGFAELFVPLFGASNAIPGFQRLDLSLAGRHEHYSDFGNTTNPKLGVNWSPVDGFMLRGSWGKSFRAPGLGENDPKSSGYGLYGDTLPCSHRPPATTCFGIGLAGGNPDLKPERATTWSFGADLTPAALPGFRASLTYWDVKYLNQIVGLRGTAGLLTNPIYSTYRTLDPSAAQVNALLASGLPINSPINATQVTYIQDGRRQNVGGTFVKGIDMDVAQSWNIGGSRLRFGAMVTRIGSLKTAVAPGAATVQVVNTLNYPQRWRGRANVGVSRGAFDSLLTLNHVGSYRQTGVTPVRDIASIPHARPAHRIQARRGQQLLDDARRAEPARQGAAVREPLRWLRSAVGQPAAAHGHLRPAEDLVMQARGRALLLAALLPAAPVIAGARGQCRKLRGAAGSQGNGVVVTAATAITPQGQWLPPPTLGMPSPVQVPFCRVEGLIEKRIGFELWLPPAQAWNGRLLAPASAAMQACSISATSPVGWPRASPAPPPTADTRAAKRAG